MPNHFDAQSSTVLATSNPVTLSATVDDDTLHLVQTIVEAAEERKGADITLLRVSDVSSLADYFVIVTGYSKVQVRAIARSVEDAVEETLQRRPIRIEGLAEGTWVLHDYGDVIVHVQMPHEREFYNLEAFWGHADRISLASLSS